MFMQPHVMREQELVVHLPLDFLKQAIRLIGYSGCLITGIGPIVLVLLVFYTGGGISDRFYCPSNTLTTMRSEVDAGIYIDKYLWRVQGNSSWAPVEAYVDWERTPDPLQVADPIPTISACIEKWPHVSVFIFGVGASNICIGAIFMSLLYDAKRTENFQLVPIGSYICLILSWGLVGSSIRGGVEWISDVHNIIAVISMVSSFSTATVFVIKQNETSNIACLLLLALNILSILGVVLCQGGAFLYKDDLQQKALLGNMLAISELSFTSSFSILCAYLFYNGILKSIKLHIQKADEQKSTHTPNNDGILSNAVVDTIESEQLYQLGVVPTWNKVMYVSPPLTYMGWNGTH
jgi:hypothetical protein